MDVHTASVGEESARLAAVVENVPIGVVMVGTDGNVQMCNKHALGMLGSEAESSVRNDLPLERALRAGEVVRNERSRLERSDGWSLTIDVTTVPVRDSGGKIIGAVALLQDVTQQERHEHSERAEREFVTNAAHQLQSPLAGIISAVEVLQRGAKDGPERDVFLGHIERESNRLARLARALLILARAQTGVEPPKNEMVALEPLLSAIGAALRPAAGVSVHVSCPPELAVITNRELVEQALMNVAENAAKYTTAGRITLEARPVDGAAEVAVSDTGPGIPESEGTRVFERFYRGTTAGPNGFGLGFAVVHSAIRAVDGELHFEERDGGGTIVRIRLAPVASLVDTG